MPPSSPIVPEAAEEVVWSKTRLESGRKRDQDVCRPPSCMQHDSHGACTHTCTKHVASGASPLSSSPPRENLVGCKPKRLPVPCTRKYIPRSSVSQSPSACLRANVEQWAEPQSNQHTDRSTLGKGILVHPSFVPCRVASSNIGGPLLVMLVSCSKAYLAGSWMMVHREPRQRRHYHRALRRPGLVTDVGKRVCLGLSSAAIGHQIGAARSLCWWLRTWPAESLGVV